MYFRRLTSNGESAIQSWPEKWKIRPWVWIFNKQYPNQINHRYKNEQIPHPFRNLFHDLSFQQIAQSSIPNHQSHIINPKSKISIRSCKQHPLLTRLSAADTNALFLWRINRNTTDGGFAQVFDFFFGFAGSVPMC